MGRALVRKSVGAPRMIEVILSVGHDLHEVALGVIGISVRQAKRPQRRKAEDDH